MPISLLERPVSAFLALVGLILLWAHLARSFRPAGEMKMSPGRVLLVGLVGIALLGSSGLETLVMALGMAVLVVALAFGWLVVAPLAFWAGGAIWPARFARRAK